MKFILSLLLMISFVFILCGWISFKKKNDHTQIAHLIQEKTIKTLEKRHKMNACGIGGGMMGSIYMLNLSFQINLPLTRDEARRILADCVKEFLSNVNSSKEIRPYLRNYPFTLENIDLEIFTRNIDGSDVFDPFIRVATTFMGKLVYNTKDKDTQNKFGYKSVYKETFEEALKILECENK